MYHQPTAQRELRVFIPRPGGKIQKCPYCPQGRGEREENCCLTSDPWVTKRILFLAQVFPPDEDYGQKESECC